MDKKQKQFVEIELRKISKETKLDLRTVKKIYKKVLTNLINPVPEKEAKNNG